jgi:hypothetical protein
MKQKFNKAMKIISILVMVVGAFGCLCEYDGDTWYIWLLSAFALAMIGFYGTLYFTDSETVKKYTLKFFETVWINIYGIYSIIIKSFKFILHFIHRRIEFIKLINKYHKKGYTYKEIAKIVISTYKEVKSQN